MARPLPSERLVARLREDEVLAALLPVAIPEDAGITRTFAGPAQRSVGAWTWRLANRDDRTLRVGEVMLFVGSTYSVRDLASAPALEYSVEWGEVSVYPALART